VVVSVAEETKMEEEVKCPQYDPDAYGCTSPWVMGRCPLMDPPYGCYKGWRQFWTPAERAGLKAMGRNLRTSKSHDWDAVMGIIWTIREYVRYARAVKEGK
jgi:hypothetical protein